MVAQLPILDEPERHQVLYGWNQTRAEALDCCIHELFEAQVDRSPDAVALLFEGAQISYAQLNARANRLAHRLRGLGVGPDERVAICVQRGMEMVVALLGVLKAGGAYVPFDPGYPPARLRMMLEDAAPAMLLTQRDLCELFTTAAKVPILLLDDASGWQEEPQTNLDRWVLGLRPDHLAYVIYTSGSTGEPKGVMISHSGAINTLHEINRRFLVGAGDRVLGLSSVAFDLSVYDVFGILAQGGALVIPPPGPRPDASKWRRVVLEIGITIWNSVPALMQLFVEAALQEGAGAFESIRLVLLSGDLVPVRLVEQVKNLFPKAHIYSLGGATEGSIWSVSFPVAALDPRRTTIPYGRSLANQQVYILDEGCEPVPVGVTGELYIGGAGVARGYLRRPELTEQRFLLDPFAAEPGARMYRTGDLGRWLADGNIEFLGRNDFQVKVRGFRIELGEIEARLHEHPGVGEAVVIAREDAAGEKRLVAYYTAGSRGESAGAEQLRAHLSAVLPEHMVPAAYVRLHELPRTPNGKLDRHSLPAPEISPGPGYEPPQGRIESELAQIWAELLQLERVGRHDDFFALGGHSLLGMRLVVRLRQSLNSK